MIIHTHIYIHCSKIVIGKIFNVYEISILCSLRLNLFDQKYSKNSNIVKYKKYK